MYKHFFDVVLVLRFAGVHGRHEGHSEFTQFHVLKIIFTLEKISNYILEKVQ